MNLPEGNSENVSQLRESNFTPASAFLYHLGEKQMCKNNKNHSKEINKKSNLRGKMFLRKYIGNTIAREECKGEGENKVSPWRRDRNTCKDHTLKTLAH